MAVIPLDIPQAITAPNQTGLTRIVAQPDRFCDSHTSSQHSNLIEH
jgi:hypothetical protein